MTVLLVVLVAIFLVSFLSSVQGIYCIVDKRRCIVHRSKVTLYKKPRVTHPYSSFPDGSIFHLATVRFCAAGDTTNSHHSQAGRPNPNQRLKCSQRRSFLRSIGALGSAVALPLRSPNQAFARGLVQFPCNKVKLQNTYHFMRSGQSLLEERDILSTNPLFLTNRENALSDLGIQQVEEACRHILSQEGATPTIVGYSLAANCLDSAAIVGKELRLGQNRLVPEFTFLDPRAVGKWDILPLQTTEEAIWAMDAAEAGEYGSNGRPPPNDDGTPNETLADQVIRLRQYFSVLESFYSGDTVLIIFPDGTGPALLTCLIGGIPLNRVHEINYRPGEIRFDVNYESARALMTEIPSKEYSAIIERGIKQLQVLREDPEKIINVKDQAYEVERVEQINKERMIAKKKEEAELALKAQKHELQENLKSYTVTKSDMGTFSTMSQGLIISCLSAFGIASVLTAMAGLKETATEKQYMQTDEERVSDEINELQVTKTSTFNKENINGPNFVINSSLDKNNLNGPTTVDFVLDTEGSTEGASKQPNSEIQDSNTALTVLNQSPEERAKLVMEAYLEEDDGGNAWLDLMSGILQDEQET